MALVGVSDLLGYFYSHFHKADMPSSFKRQATACSLLASLLAFGNSPLILLPQFIFLQNTCIAKEQPHLQFWIMTFHTIQQVSCNQKAWITSLLGFSNLAVAVQEDGSAGWQAVLALPMSYVILKTVWKHINVY